MTKPASQFVYVTFINATPEKVWDALTDPEMMKQYWFGMYQDSDWKVGSPWRLVYRDGRVANVGEVLEVDKPRRLAVTWRGEIPPELKADGYSHCLYEIEPVDDAVKLTITHGVDKPDAKIIHAVSGGWPKVLSNLKSFLETGEAVLGAKI